MLSIRFKPVGRKHQRSFRIVVVERRSKLKGPPREDLGFYNPLTKEGRINKERIAHWLTHGAKPTVSVHNLLVRYGAIKGPKISISIRKKTKTAEDAQSEGIKDRGQSEEGSERSSDSVDESKEAEKGEEQKKEADGSS